MKKGLIEAAVILLLMFTPFSRVFCADSSESRPLDKEAHIAVSYGLTLTQAVVLKKAGVPHLANVIISPAIAYGIGYLKEKGDPVFDREDLKANLVGSLLGAGFFFTFGWD